MGRDRQRGPRAPRGVGPRALELDDAAARALTTHLRAIAKETPADTARVGELLARDQHRSARLLFLSGDMLRSPPTVRAIRLATAIELMQAGLRALDETVGPAQADAGRRGDTMVASAPHGVRLGLFLLVRGAALIANEPAPVRVAVARAVRQVGRERGRAIVAQRPRERRSNAGTLYGLAGRLGALAAAFPAPVGDAIVCFATEIGLSLQLSADPQALREVGGVTEVDGPAPVVLADGRSPEAAIAEAHRRWTRAARAAPSYTVGLAEAMRAVVDEMDGTRADALRIGLLDLLVGDFFALLSRLRAAEAVWWSNVLALRLRNDLAAATA